MASLFAEFLDSTTIHGVRFLNSTNSVARRLIWLLFVLAGFVFFSTQLYESLQRFFDYKVNTVVHMSNDAITKFPAITICNHNALRKSLIEKNKDDPVVQIVMTSAREFMKLEADEKANVSVKNIRVTGQQMRDIYYKYGHNMSSTKNGGMLFHCMTPNGKICNETDFKRILTYSGLCYTLNSGKGQEMYSALSGRFAAVNIILSAQVDDYSEAVGRTQATGVFVLIHDQLDPPVADTHGMWVGPGFAALISIKKQKMVSLKSPYESKCGDEDLAPGYPYSREGCFRKCQEAFVIKTCNCSIAVDTILKLTDVPMCDMEQNFKCAIPAATERFSKEKGQCNCPFACDSIEYMPSISYAPYPNDIDARKDAIQVLKYEGMNTTEKEIANKIIEIRKNWISLQIFYQQMDYLTMTHVPASTPVGLFAEIGGLLGISLGASFLTVIEIFDLAVFLVTQKIAKTKTFKKTGFDMGGEGKTTESSL